ncbi:YetF domain-containing protein [Thermincola ferriacetica]
MNEIIQAMFRSAFAFVALLVLARLVGRQQISELTFYHFVTGITIGSIAANMAGSLNIDVWPIFAALVTFVFLSILAGYVSLQNRPLRKLIQGEPTVVIHNGKVLEENMGLTRFTMDDLMSQLRLRGVFDISQVEFAILEPNGHLSVQLKSQYRPATPKDLGIATKYEGVPSELIVDGKLVEANLVQNNLSEEWLMQELEKKGVHTIGEVALAAINSQGELYVDLKEDKLDHVTDIRDKEV